MLRTLKSGRTNIQENTKHKKQSFPKRIFMQVSGWFHDFWAVLRIKTLIFLYKTLFYREL